MAEIDCMVNNIPKLISNAMRCVCPHEHDREIKRLSTRVHHKLVVDPFTFNRIFFLFLFLFFQVVQLNSSECVVAPGSFYRLLRIAYIPSFKKTFI